LEIKEGPFEPKHAGVFAPWSPPPDDPAVTAFVASLEAACRVDTPPSSAC
jgi:hypothetical protein